MLSTGFQKDLLTHAFTFQNNYGYNLTKVEINSILTVNPFKNDRGPVGTLIYGASVGL